MLLKRKVISHFAIGLCILWAMIIQFSICYALSPRSRLLQKGKIDTSMTLSPHNSHMVCKNRNRIKIPQYLTQCFALGTRREMLTFFFRLTPLPRSWGSVKRLDPGHTLAFTSRRCDICPYFGRLEPLTLQKICGTAANHMSFAYVFQPQDLHIDI
jgi:hypothetical protein